MPRKLQPRLGPALNAVRAGFGDAGRILRRTSHIHDPVAAEDAESRSRCTPRSEKVAYRISGSRGASHESRQADHQLASILAGLCDCVDSANNHLGVVDGTIRCAMCTAALDELPAYRYPFPAGDMLIANLDDGGARARALADEQHADAHRRPARSSVRSRIRARSSAHRSTTAKAAKTRQRLRRRCRLACS